MILQAFDGSGQDGAAIVSLSGRLRKNRSELWESLEHDMALNSSKLETAIVSVTTGIDH